MVEISSNGNKINILAPKPGLKEIGPKQGSLDLQVEKDVGGIGMGVLSDGTPYLNQRGLAALCGVMNAHIGTISSHWAEPDQKPRIVAIKGVLAKLGLSAPAAHIEIVPLSAWACSGPEQNKKAPLPAQKDRQGRGADVKEQKAVDVIEAVLDDVEVEFREGLSTREAAKRVLFALKGMAKGDVLAAGWNQLHRAHLPWLGPGPGLQEAFDAMIEAMLTL